MTDAVNSPSHYKAGGFEVIDIIKAYLTPEEYRGFVKGNAIKYLLRLNNKGNPGQDAGKAAKNAEWLAESYKDKPENVLGGVETLTQYTDAQALKYREPLIPGDPYYPYHS